MLDASAVQGVLDALAAAYPDARPALHFTTPYELLVATILSAQCTDRQVNLVTDALFAEANTPAAICALGEEGLARRIHSCGFYRSKAKNILGTSRLLLERWGGEVPADFDALQTLPGVGRKTANVVVSNAFGIPGIAVDTHVFRVSNRLGLAEAKDVLETEMQLRSVIPKPLWGTAHHWLIYHGRQVCAARKPRCGDCVLRRWCEHPVEAETPAKTEKG